MKKCGQLLRIVVVLTMVCCLVPAVCAETLSPHYADVPSSNAIANAAVFGGDVQTPLSAVTYITQWGSEGTGNGEFDLPEGVAVDSSGNVYVADTQNNRIQKFTSSGSPLKTWGSEGDANGHFDVPSGIAVDSSGNVYVADTYNDRIQKFTASGTFIKAWGEWGSENGEFYHPYGVAVDKNGYVYVADSGNDRIQKSTSSGTFIKAWGSSGTGNGQFDVPSGIAVDSSGNVYVADTNNHRIQKFTSSGTFIKAWGSYGDANGQFSYPIGVAVDSSGNVYITDSNNARIQVFFPSSTYITKWGSDGIGNGQFDYPCGIAVDKSGNVYVADTGNYRIQKFRYPSTITVMVPNGGNNWKQGSTQTIKWSYTGSPGTKVKIDLLKGTAVNRVINASTSIGSVGSGSYSWKIPYNQVLGTDYKIRVTSTTNAAHTDKSNANFTISAGVPITVTVPNGGQSWVQGSTHAITWSYTGITGSKVKIDLLKGTAVNRVINASTSIGSAGSGSYSWKIPSNQVVGTDYKIRITSTTNAAYTDKSNANFTISA
jgi:DNA-binding beta-propeller fold protein YncE